MNQTSVPNSAYAEQVMSHSRMLVRIAYTYLHNLPDAEDAMQDVFCRYFSDPPRIESDEHLKAWLIRATINCCKNALRRRKYRNHARLFELEEVADDGDGLNREVAEAVFRLDEKQRTAVHLYYYEGLDINETARILGISAAAVSKRLSRARENLKIAL